MMIRNKVIRNKVIRMERKESDMRTSGILFPVFSLPGKYGIGCFSVEAYRFVDFLKEAGQTYWQILPLGPTGYGDSPYQSFSTFAGNPYLISLEELISQGLLSREECEAVDFGDDDSAVDYGKLYMGRWDLLRKAYTRSEHKNTEEFLAFQKENDFWLVDYALFMAVKDAHAGAGASDWEPDIRDYEPEAVKKWAADLCEETGFYEYLQFEFARQWKRLKDYAAGQGIQIIGDIPIYVSADSADFWAHRELFQLDDRGRIRMIAGVPPDGFSATGQVWGNPLYNWEKHKETGYDWWIRRIKKCRELYDVIRIDHFRGFDEYFAIPAESDTAAAGHWEKGPGTDLFDAIEAALGKTPIIAEDLGYVTETVRQLVRDTGFPNMKVLEFAFDSRDSSGAMEYLPYRYQRNCVVYTGTHDNETLRGWIDSILPVERQQVCEYLDVRTKDPQEIVEKMVLAAFSSVADYCIIPLQDYLGLDNSARINQPSTNGKNWKWRVEPKDLSAELAGRILRLTTLFGRLPE